MADANKRMTGIATLFAAPEPTTATISSTMIRSLITCGKTAAAAALVPPAVATALHHAAES
jgi:phosphopantetheine adenylyltransferase